MRKVGLPSASHPHWTHGLITQLYPQFRIRGTNPDKQCPQSWVAVYLSLLPTLNAVWFVCFPVPAPCAGEAAREREVSEDKVTYPLDEEGDNLNSYGEGKKKKREYIQCVWGSLDAGNFSQRRKKKKSWEKVSVEREDEKWEKYRRWKALLRVGVSLYPLPGTERVRDIERAQENERERGCVCASPRRIGYRGLDAGALLRH